MSEHQINDQSAAATPPVNRFEAFVAAVPEGGRWWFEEFTLRGSPGDQPGGVTRGAHVTLGVEYPDPMGGEPIRRVTPPLAVGELPTDVQLPALLPVGVLALQRQVDALAAAVAERDAVGAQLAASLQTAVTERDAAQAKLAAVAAAIA